MEALQMDPLEQNGSFLENPFNDFNYILAVYGDHLPK
jgi:hypothetical protein